MEAKKINDKTFKKATLEDYQQEIFDIWPQLADRPALHTWSRVIQHATTACEGMRKRDWSQVLEEIAKTIIWWLSFIRKCNLLCQESTHGVYDEDIVFAFPFSATEIIWDKYPWVCPVEFGLAVHEVKNIRWDDRPAQVCMCLARKKDVEERSDDEKERAKKSLREFARLHWRHHPRYINSMEGMLQSIFSGPIYQYSFQELFFHLIEEVGEVSEALSNATVSECLSSDGSNGKMLKNERKRKIYAITEELADVFSWAVSIVAKVQSHLISFEHYLDARHEKNELHTIRDILKGSQHISLSAAIWQKYGLKHNELRCDHCNKRPCTCTEQRTQPLYAKALNPEQLSSIPELLRKAIPKG